MHPQKFSMQTKKANKKYGNALLLIPLSIVSLIACRIVAIFRPGLNLQREFLGLSCNQYTVHSKINRMKNRRSKKQHIESSHSIRYLCKCLHCNLTPTVSQKFLCASKTCCLLKFLCKTQKKISNVMENEKHYQ